MKIIFKSKNQLIEKLVLDERLILNEAEDPAEKSEMLMDQESRVLIENTDKLSKTIELTQKSIDKITEKFKIVDSIVPQIENIKSKALKINEQINDEHLQLSTIKKNSKTHDYYNGKFNASAYINEKNGFTTEAKKLLQQIYLFNKDIVTRTKNDKKGLFTKIKDKILELFNQGITTGTNRVIKITDVINEISNLDKLDKNITNTIFYGKNIRIKGEKADCTALNQGYIDMYGQLQVLVDVTNRKFDSINNIDLKTNKITIAGQVDKVKEEKQAFTDSILEARQILNNIVIILDFELEIFNKIKDEFSNAAHKATWQDTINNSTKISTPKEIIDMLNDFSVKTNQHTQIGPVSDRQTILNWIKEVKLELTKWSKCLNQANQLLEITNFGILLSEYLKFMEDGNKLLMETTKVVGEIKSKIDTNLKNTSDKTNSVLNGKKVSDGIVRSKERWTDAFNQIYSNHELSSEQIAVQSNELWNRYLQEGPLAKVKNFKDTYEYAFKKEANAYGYDEISNPFIKFILNLDRLNIKPGQRGYSAIHNLVVRDRLDAQKLDEYSILFCNDLYTKNNADINWYVTNYTEVSNEKELSFTSPTNRYFSETQTKLFADNLFFKEGEILTKPTLNFNKTNYPVDKELRQKDAITKFYNEAVSKESFKEDTDADTFIRKCGVVNAADAKKLILELITKYSFNKTININNGGKVVAKEIEDVVGAIPNSLFSLEDYKKREREIFNKYRMDQTLFTSIFTALANIINKKP